MSIEKLVLIIFIQTKLTLINFSPENFSHLNGRLIIVNKDKMSSTMKGKIN